MLHDAAQCVPVAEQTQAQGRRDVPEDPDDNGSPWQENAGRGRETEKLTSPEMMAREPGSVQPQTETTGRQQSVKSVASTCFWAWHFINFSLIWKGHARNSPTDCFHTIFLERLASVILHCFHPTIPKVTLRLPGFAMISDIAHHFSCWYLSRWWCCNPAPYTLVLVSSRALAWAINLWLVDMNYKIRVPQPIKLCNPVIVELWHWILHTWVLCSIQVVCNKPVDTGTGSQAAGMLLQNANKRLMRIAWIMKTAPRSTINKTLEPAPEEWVNSRIYFQRYLTCATQ